MTQIRRKSLFEVSFGDTSKGVIRQKSKLSFNYGLSMYFGTQSVDGNMNADKYQQFAVEYFALL